MGETVARRVHAAGDDQIAADDIVYAIGHLLMNSALAGPVNLVGPRPVTQEAMTRMLSGEGEVSPAFYGSFMTVFARKPG